jgi:flagellar hook assembly protein FlgD
MDTKIDIYDAAGRAVRSLFSGEAPAGRSEFHWDGTSDSGSAVSSGIYMAVSRSGTLRLERKLVLLR